MFRLAQRSALLFTVLIASCSSQQTTNGNTKPSASAAPKTIASGASSSSTPAVVASAVPDDGGGEVKYKEEAAPIPEPTFDQIASGLFMDKANLSTVTAACPASVPSEARIRCLFDERYRGDTKAANLAYELYVKWRIVSGVESAHTMDGGYRGMIRLEPALPVGSERKHIEWIASAMRDIDQLFTELAKFGADNKAGGASDAGAAAAAASGHPKRYRFKPIGLRFMRSVAARTPSAYAREWTVSWNLAGSLHTSGDAVRETLVHEIFHLNDYAHPPPGGEAWSFTALGATFDAIVKKCGTAIPCLTPYTPNETIVRNGTYYSFQPGNGVREYAAELALRYFREQRAALRSLPKVKPFKCGPPENARSWALMRDEFWDGIDAVPACGP